MYMKLASHHHRLSFPFIKILHEPHSFAVKKQNTVFASFPSFPGGRCSNISFSFFTQTVFLSTKFPGFLSVDHISAIFRVQMLLYSWYPFKNKSTSKFVVTTIGISSFCVSFVKSIFVCENFYISFFPYFWSCFFSGITSLSRRSLKKAKPLHLKWWLDVMKQHFQFSYLIIWSWENVYQTNPIRWKQRNVGKHSKIRITGLASANAVGNKLQMFVIYKAKNPRCFKNIKKLPRRYRS